MIFSLVKYGMFVVLCLVGIGQTLLYFRLKKNWRLFPVVAGTITESKLFDFTGFGAQRTYEAQIKFKYRFREKDYESNTPALRSPQVFPLYEYEQTLLDKYKVGEIHNIRVHPNLPDMAFLEIAPLSKLSVFLVPIMILGYFGYLVGLGLYFSYAFDVFTN